MVPGLAATSWSATAAGERVAAQADVPTPTAKRITATTTTRRVEINGLSLDRTRCHLTLIAYVVTGWREHPLRSIMRERGERRLSRRCALAVSSVRCEDWPPYRQSAVPPGMSTGTAPMLSTRAYPGR